MTIYIALCFLGIIAWVIFLGVFKSRDEEFRKPNKPGDIFSYAKKSKEDLEREKQILEREQKQKQREILEEQRYKETVELAIRIEDRTGKVFHHKDGLVFSTGCFEFPFKATRLAVTKQVNCIAYLLFFNTNGKLIREAKIEINVYQRALSKCADLLALVSTRVVFKGITEEEFFEITDLKNIVELGLDINN